MMQVHIENIKAHLGKIKPVYLVCGEEPLQINDAVHDIIEAAKRQGYEEREFIDIEEEVDWQQFLTATNNVSLFVTKKIIDLQLKSPKIGSKAGIILSAFLSQGDPNIVLLIRTGKIDKSVLLTAWVKAVDDAGIVIRVWNIPLPKMQGWIIQRARQQGIGLAMDAAKLLVERTEGNCLATAQELEKITLLCDLTQQITLEQVDQMVSEQSRFDVYQLVDYALAGNRKKISMVINALKAENVSSVLILWALHREIRALYQIIFATEVKSLAQAINSYHPPILKRRIPLIQRSLECSSRKHWQTLLSHCTEIDQVIKGRLPGDEWTMLQQLCHHFIKERNDYVKSDYI